MLTRRHLMAGVGRMPCGGRDRRAGAGRLAEPAGQGDRDLSAGRRRRHHGAHPVPEAVGDVGQVLRHRQPRRRRRHHRRGGCGQGRSGRLYDHARRHRLLGQSGALSQAVVRLRQGFRAGVSGVARAQHPGGDAVGRAEDRGRHHRAGEEDAGRPRLRLVGQRHAAASLPGAAAVHGQGADQPHPLSRRRRWR